MAGLLRVTPAGDRLFVRARDGRIVGWYDPEDAGQGLGGAGEGGRIRIAHEPLRAEVLAALAPFVTGEVTVGPPPVPTSARLASLALHPDDDLAPNRPGEALHAQLDHLPAPGNPARRLRDPHRAARALLAAERTVGAALDGWEGAGWRLLHSVPLPGADRIPHLAVGPGGVLAVHTVPARRLWGRTGADRLLDAGRGGAVPPLRLARRRAERAAYALATTVRPVLVLVAPAGAVPVPPGPADVRILSDADVPALAALGGVHKPADVETLYATARDRRTWTRS
ncbi:NERD domain-containing protein [Streptomyces qinzhouensis]|uniref:NERD domain-containing protein n=1 Tax=Streptomyces qinzhouensis TaxID=2599401 RepID=A0A5B8JMK1_9ACTN|nr:NERD domain-containing protein [Streptomyces qinzhouensis]QDY79010.1 NERD domain-containing protein [Streptomyces qinzhouensis]